MINRFSTLTPGDYSMKYVPTNVTPDFSKLGDLLSNLEESQNKIFAGAAAMRPRENPFDQANREGEKYMQTNLEYEDKIREAFKQDIGQGMQMLESYRNKLVQDKTSGAYAAIDKNYELYQDYNKRKEADREKFRQTEMDLIKFNELDARNNLPKFATNYDYNTNTYNTFSLDLPSPNVNVSEHLNKLALSPVKQETAVDNIEGTVYGKNNPAKDYFISTSVLTPSDIKGKVSLDIMNNAEIQDQIGKESQVELRRLQQNPKLQELYISMVQQQDIARFEVPLPAFNNEPFIKVLSDIDNVNMQKNGSFIRQMLNNLVGKDVFPNVNGSLTDTERKVVSDFVSEYHQNKQFYSNENLSLEQVVRKGITNRYVSEQVGARATNDVAIQATNDDWKLWWMGNNAQKKEQKNNAVVIPIVSTTPSSKSVDWQSRQKELQTKENDIYSDLRLTLAKSGVVGSEVQNKVDNLTETYKRLEQNGSLYNKPVSTSIQLLGLDPANENHQQVFKLIQERVNIGKNKHEVQENLNYRNISAVKALGLNDTPYAQTIISTNSDFNSIHSSLNKISSNYAIQIATNAYGTPSPSKIKNSPFDQYLLANYKKDPVLNKLFAKLTPEQTKAFIESYVKNKTSINNALSNASNLPSTEIVELDQIYTPSNNSKMETVVGQLVSSLNSGRANTDAMFSSEPSGSKPISSVEMFNILMADMSSDFKISDVNEGKLKFDLKMVSPKGSMPAYQIRLVAGSASVETPSTKSMIIYPLFNGQPSSLIQDYWNDLSETASNTNASEPAKQFAKNALLLKNVPVDVYRDISNLDINNRKVQKSGNDTYVFTRIVNGYKVTKNGKLVGEHGEYNTVDAALIAALND